MTLLYLLLQFECCGFDSYMDYEENTAFQCGSQLSQACGVPWTCCRKDLPVRVIVYKPLCNFSRCPAKATSWHVRPMKTQINLHICAVWSESSKSTLWVAEVQCFLDRKLRIWSDCTDAQTVFNRHCTHIPYAGYQLIWLLPFYFSVKGILGNPDMIHSIPTAFNDECSGYGMYHVWVTEEPWKLS